jgi:hypothetical protein
LQNGLLSLAATHQGHLPGSVWPVRSCHPETLGEAASQWQCAADLLLEKLLRNTRAGIPEFLSDRSRTSPNAGEWNLFEEDKVVLQKICWDTKILNFTSVQAATFKRVDQKLSSFWGPRQGSVCLLSKNYTRTRQCRSCCLGLEDLRFN